MAIRKREAWAARHLQDFRLAGTVAQIKWFVVGERGQTYMKELIEEEKKRLQKSEQRTALWNDWLEKSKSPQSSKFNAPYMLIYATHKRDTWNALRRT